LIFFKGGLCDLGLRGAEQQPEVLPPSKKVLRDFQWVGQGNDQPQRSQRRSKWHKKPKENREWKIHPHRPAPSIAETGGKRPFRCLRPLPFRGRVRKGPVRFEKRRKKRDAGRRFFWILFFGRAKKSIDKEKMVSEKIANFYPLKIRKPL